MPRTSLLRVMALWLPLAGACTGLLERAAGPGGGERDEEEDDATGPGVDPGELGESPIGDELGEHCEGAIDPGRAVLHRLSRLELGYTLSDLTGLAVATDDFPADESAAGFDNQASALAMSTLHVEKYFETAGKVVAQVLGDAGARTRVLGTLGSAASDGEVGTALGDFAARAFRRPVADDEVARLVALYRAARDDGADFDAAIALPLRAVLAAPSFVFHSAVPAVEEAGAERLDAHALAARLSYFLWSSLPDAALREAASRGELKTAAQLEAQVARMLADERAERFVQSFAGQWLDLRALPDARPDPALFPDFDAALRTAMAAESYALFRDLLAPGSDVRDLLTGGYSHLNAELAAHYGVPADGLGDELERVALDGTERVGFLTQGSFLTLTSHPQRTSLVKRGKWVLEQLLCAPPPAPPPGVEDLGVDEPGAEQDRSLRELVEEHRSNPSCAVCHTAMDPIGFGLENFDAVGAFRTTDSGFAIDASGELPGADGQKRAFDGARALSELVASDPRLGRCIAQKVFTFALARGPAAADRCTLDALAARLAKGDYSLFDLIVSTTAVPAFTHTRPETRQE